METQEPVAINTRTPKTPKAPKEPKKEPKGNAWTHHVKNYCVEHGVAYRDALRSEECKKMYRESKTQ